ncbi:hypothetical protein GWK47_036856 [Chionoecetes opilio]|uniref:Uncharacterized protein n=1 Tax=Chionoecetes opilio TaxID=41210 RepID=A0A8J5CYW6_CHIOP|nr:hypothetical protein GWK47_036856 [Chionoecetes opilio]
MVGDRYIFQCLFRLPKSTEAEGEQWHQGHLRANSTGFILTRQNSLRSDAGVRVPLASHDPHYRPPLSTHTARIRESERDHHDSCLPTPCRVCTNEWGVPVPRALTNQAAPLLTTSDGRQWCTRLLKQTRVSLLLVSTIPPNLHPRPRLNLLPLLPSDATRWAPPSQAFEDIR